MARGRLCSFLQSFFSYYLQPTDLKEDPDIDALISTSGCSLRASVARAKSAGSISVASRVRCFTCNQLAGRPHSPGGRSHNHMPGDRGFPVGIKQLSTEISGHSTDVIVSTYLNAKVVMVTQTGAVGTIVEARWALKRLLHCQPAVAGVASDPSRRQLSNHPIIASSMASIHTTPSGRQDGRLCK